MSNQEPSRSTASVPPAEKRAKTLSDNPIAPSNALNFYGINKVATYTKDDQQFHFINSIYSEQCGFAIPVPLEEDLLRETDLDSKQKIFKANIADLNLSEIRIRSLGSERKVLISAMQSLRSKRKETEVIVQKLKSGRSNARLAADYWGKQEEHTDNYIEFCILIKRATSLLVHFDREKQIREDEKQEKKKKEKEKRKNQTNSGAHFGDEERTQTATTTAPAPSQGSITLGNTGEEIQVDEYLPSATKHNEMRKVRSPAGKKAGKMKYISEHDFNKEFQGMQEKIRRKKGAWKNYTNVKKSDWEWAGGTITCTICSSQQSCLRQIVQHSIKKTHLQNKKGSLDEKSKKAVIYRQPTMKKAVEDTCPMLTQPVKEYRMSLVRMIAEINVPLKSIDDIEATDWRKRYVDKKFSSGGSSNLGPTIIPIVHMEDLEVLRTILKQRGKDAKSNTIVYQNFGLIYDGTPSFAEAEAVIIRLVTIDGEIIDLLVRVALFKGKLSGLNLARHIFDTVTTRLGLDMKDARVAMCDRASTNKKALNDLRTIHAVTIADFFCFSHTFSNAGKQMTDSKNSSFISAFRKQWQSVVQYNGEARSLSKREFKTAVLVAGGVRFYVHYEQIVQIVDYGLEKIINNIISVCIDRGYSKASSETLNASFGNALLSKKAELGMAILEGSAVADGGKSFCEGCYILEGDSPLIFTTADVLERIEEKMEDVIEMPRVERNMAQVLRLVEEGYRVVYEPKDRDKHAVEEAKLADAAAKSHLDDLQARLKEITHPQTRSRGNSRIRNRPYNTLTDAEKIEVERLNADIVPAISTYKEAKKVTEDARKTGENTELEHTKWIQTFPHRCEASLTAYAKSLVYPGHEYYRKQFLDENGDLYHARKAADCAATVLNPLWLKNQNEDDTVLVDSYADLLVHFRFPEFTDDFIKEFKKEIPKMILRSKEPFDWDGMVQSRLYSSRLQRKRRKGVTCIDREADIETVAETDWKKDPGEKADRIWRWWRPIVATGSISRNFPCYHLALRLVGLVQVSSCAVERVFSQLKYIRDRCGDNIYEDMLEIRMFAQCNGDLTSKLFNKVHSEI